ncbi:MAG TPA: DoxX-like family protein [Desertimonas sp.]|nr:DoxX-like family protein [Desertimonas sp.]
MARRKPIYVESLINAPIEALWKATQEPTLHERWDVRFGQIEHLTRDDGEAQRFRYATTVAPGVTIAGTGESLGDRDRPDGTRWSGLKFWASDRRSIIDAGAGYWRYVPVADGVRFLTRYDYRPRWGTIGDQVDRWLFRPLFGWATAWSFDRLRIWLEDGTAPEVSRNLAIGHASATSAVAGTWIYHGLIPKLLMADPSEQVFWRSLGFSGGAARTLVRLTGIPEVAMGVATAVCANRRWPFVATIVAMPALAAGAIASERRLWARAFNPVSLNAAMVALAAVALATHNGRPSGRRPLRTAPDSQPEVGPLP